MAVEPLTLTTTALRAAVRELEDVDVPARTLADWMGRRLVTPSVRRAGGRGEGSIWSLGDLARARLIARLRHGGISAMRVGAIFAYLEKELQEVLQPRSTATLVVDQQRAYVVRPGQVDVEVPTGQLRMKFKFDSLFRGNEAAAARARRAA